MKFSRFFCGIYTCRLLIVIFHHERAWDLTEYDYDQEFWLGIEWHLAPRNKFITLDKHDVTDKSFFRIRKTLHKLMSSPIEDTFFEILFFCVCSWNSFTWDFQKKIFSWWQVSATTFSELVWPVTLWSMCSTPTEENS